MPPPDSKASAWEQWQAKDMPSSLDGGLLRSIFLAIVGYRNVPIEEAALNFDQI